MGAVASQITSLSIVYSTVYLGADQRKHESSVLLAFVWGIRRGPVNSPHKWPVTRKMFPVDVIMKNLGRFSQAEVEARAWINAYIPQKMVMWLLIKAIALDKQYKGTWFQ